MKNCPTCGALNADNAPYCQSCGSSFNSGAYYQTQPAPYAAQQSGQYRAAPNVNVYNTAAQIPLEYRPLSPWAYLGYTLLYSIPLIGFVFLLVFALSDGNINRRNHARGYLCAMLIAAIVGVIAWLVFGAALSSLYYW